MTDVANEGQGPEPLAGVLSVLSTPFTEDGAVDGGSLVRLVEHNLAHGVDGIVCFGLAGEVYKLTDAERRQVLRLVVDTVGGAVPVVAGTEHDGVEGATQRSVEAREIGADALMMYPPTFVTPEPEAILDYYATVGDHVDVPIVVQDAPAWTGVPLPVDLLVSIRQQIDAVRYVKVEAPPTAVKIRAVVHDGGLQAIGGYGALHLAEELSAGIVAFMPGCAMPGFYRRLWDLHERGDDDAMWELFIRVLPLLSFQLSSLDTFVSVQKVLLRRLGVQASTRMRRPGRSLDDAQVEWLDRLLERCELDAYLT